MRFQGFIVIGYLVFSCFAASCYGVTFSSLQKTLIVSASSPLGHVLKAGEDELTVRWSINQTLPADTDSTYKTVKLKLCFARESQVDRPWRKTVDDLKKDKTCQHTMTTMPYNPSNNSFIWTVDKDIPEANFFVRVYVFDGEEVQVGYGQKTDELFTIHAITGRHSSIEAASVCFSVFSVTSLVGFHYIERRKGKTSQHK